MKEYLPLSALGRKWSGIWHEFVVL